MDVEPFLQSYFRSKPDRFSFIHCPLYWAAAAWLSPNECVAVYWDYTECALRLYLSVGDSNFVLAQRHQGATLVEIYEVGNLESIYAVISARDFISLIYQCMCIEECEPDVDSESEFWFRLLQGAFASAHTEIDLCVS